GGPHQGANLLQNYPVLGSAVSSASSTVITGTLNSAPSETFHLEFFASPTADPSGYGEGKTYLGSTSVTTDSSGHASFSVTAPVGNLAGQVISATATDPGNNTSEFCKAVVASSPPGQPGDAGLEAPAVGGGFAYDPVGTPWSFAGGAGVAGN